MARPKKEQEVVDFKIHIPDYTASTRQTSMMFDPNLHKRALYASEDQLAILTVAVKLLLQEVTNNRKQINQMQAQMETLAKGT